MIRQSNRGESRDEVRRKLNGVALAVLAGTVVTFTAACSDPVGSLERFDDEDVLVECHASMAPETCEH
jgi:hypothetical protein